MTVDYQQRYELLRTENNQLKQRIGILEEELILFKSQFVIDKSWTPPIELQLTASEARILGCLYTYDGARSKEQLLAALTVDVHDDSIPEIKIIDVFICKLRRKLRPYELVIDTLWGSGYQLSSFSRKRLKDWNKEEDLV